MTREPRRNARRIAIKACRYYEDAGDGCVRKAERVSKAAIWALAVFSLVTLAFAYLKKVNIGEDIAERKNTESRTEGDHETPGELPTHARDRVEVLDEEGKEKGGTT